MYNRVKKKTKQKSKKTSSDIREVIFPGVRKKCLITVTFLFQSPMLTVFFCPLSIVPGARNAAVLLLLMDEIELRMIYQMYLYGYAGSHCGWK